MEKKTGMSTIGMILFAVVCLACALAVVVIGRNPSANIHPSYYQQWAYAYNRVAIYSFGYGNTLMGELPKLTDPRENHKYRQLAAFYYDIARENAEKAVNIWPQDIQLQANLFFIVAKTGDSKKMSGILNRKVGDMRVQDYIQMNRSQPVPMNAR